MVANPACSAIAVDDAVFDPQHPSGFRPEGRDIKQQNNETTSFGIFGELDFDLSDRLRGTIGARYSYDEKDYSVAHYGWGWGGPIDTLTDGVDSNGDGTPDIFVGDYAAQRGEATESPGRVWARAEA